MRGASSLWIYILSRGVSGFSCVVLSALALLVNPYPLPFSGVGGSWLSVLYVFCFLSMLWARVELFHWKSI